MVVCVGGVESGRGVSGGREDASANDRLEMFNEERNFN